MVTRQTHAAAVASPLKLKQEKETTAFVLLSPVIAMYSSQRPLNPLFMPSSQDKVCTSWHVVAACSSSPLVCAVAVAAAAVALCSVPVASTIQLQQLDHRHPNRTPPRLQG
jgi:hypothetical protein